MKKAGITVLIIAILITSMVVVQAADPGPNLEAKAIKKVSPIYPPLARRKRIEAKVIVKLQVNSEGMAENVEFWEGNALFKPASVEAAKQWTFPKSLAGTSGHIAFKFELEDE
ncbi:MAG: TonB family protein [Acidobacteriota bacterium]